MITKEQWELIKKELSGFYGSVEFLLDDEKINVTRQRVSEDSLGIIIYINGSYTLGWGYPGETYNKIVETLWYKKTRSKYKTKEKISLTKIWGKREVKKHYNLDEKYTWYLPMFTKYSVFEKQYKKIKNLELITKLEDL